MPCAHCLNKFSKKPCKVPIDIPPVVMSGRIYYNKIREGCPCFNCLVKTICYKERFDCDEYLGFVLKVLGRERTPLL